VKKQVVSRVALTKSPEESVTAFGPWKKVKEVVGHLMDPTDLFPPRWYVTQFPNQEQLPGASRERLAVLWKVSQFSPADGQG
jgi:hypothetical protein